MDGHFVPPITMGPQVVERAARARRPGVDLDVHLMIERPERHVDAFAEAGADGITFHAEATPHVHYAVQAIREHGLPRRAGGLPGDAAGRLRARLDVDLALCMTVNPGWGGQPFIAASPGKLRRDARAAGRRRRARGRRRDRRARRRRPCAEAGATLFVAGSAVFGSTDPAAAYRAIAASARGAGSRIVPPSVRGPSSGASMATTVLIVDDHPSFRATARMLLEAEGYDVVGEAPDGAVGPRARRRLRPRWCCSTSTCPTSTASRSPRG